MAVSDQELKRIAKMQKRLQTALIVLALALGVSIAVTWHALSRPGEARGAHRTAQAAEQSTSGAKAGSGKGRSKRTPANAVDPVHGGSRGHAEQASNEPPSTSISGLSASKPGDAANRQGRN